MKSENEFPSVTVAIPAFNEEIFIEGIIKVFQRAKYPNIIEILVADGRSTDKTAEIIHQISQEDPRVKLIDNPDRVQSAGLNCLINVAQGDLFLRADAHCVYAEDYVEASVKAYQQSGALNVGGSQRFIATNSFQAYVALSVDSFLGSGGAKYRNKNYEGFAETVFLGCYRTDVLKKLGGYLTNNVTNEDYELNIRLEKEQNDAVYISPDIRVWYYPRNNFTSLFKQYFRYGKGRCLTFFRHTSYTSLRGAIPFFTILTLIVLSLALLIVGWVKTVVSFWAVLFLIVTGFATATVFRNRKAFLSEIWRGPADKAPGWFFQVLGTVFVSLTMNFAHFLGFGWQFLRYLSGRKSW